MGFGGDGHLYIWDNTAQTMDVFDSSFNLVRSFATPSGFAGESIAFDNQGHYFLANADGSGLSVFD